MIAPPGVIWRDSERETDPRKWGQCLNSHRDDGRCRHRLSSNQHNCVGRSCPEEDDE